MDQIIIAGIAGVIGYFIYKALLPLKNKIDKNQEENLGEEKTTLGTTKSAKQLSFEQIQLDLLKFTPKEIDYSKSDISGGNYWGGIEVMMIFKDVPEDQKNNFIEQAEKFCADQNWAKLSKIMVGFEKNEGIIIIKK
jgi:hypothetical protein